VTLAMVPAGKNAFRLQPVSVEVHERTRTHSRTVAA
jgi:hypothetical protein